LAGLLPNTLWYDDFMNREWPKPTWLIRDTWTRGAYGILAGEYKSFKTMLALDLALSVASGTPFLGQHEVLHPGTVSYIYEEGRPWSIHDRLFRIANAKGLADTYDPASGQIDFRGRSLPISISSLPQLDLGAESSQEAVRTHIRAARPELVILETFYLLSGGVNESNIEEVSPILEFLASISHEFGCAVILTHHFHKSKEDKRFLDRVSGSSIFLRWYESGLFVERVGAESDNTIRIMSSHREGASTMSALRMLWNSEDDGQSYFVQHLDPNDPTGDVAADDAADRIIELGQATNVKEPPSTHHRKAFDNPDLKAVRRILKREITQPRPLVELKELLGKTRTEDVQSLVRSAGYRVGTIDGTRHILPQTHRLRERRAEGARRERKPAPRTRALFCHRFAASPSALLLALTCTPFPYIWFSPTGSQPSNGGQHAVPRSVPPTQPHRPDHHRVGPRRHLLQPRSHRTTTESAPSQLLGPDGPGPSHHPDGSREGPTSQRGLPLRWPVPGQDLPAR